jgi:excisionase family DNA binding protein
MTISRKIGKTRRARVGSDQPILGGSAVQALITGELLTITQVARDLGVSRPTVASLIARGELKGYRSAIDRRARFVRADDLEKLKARAFVALNDGEDSRRQGAAVS